MTQCRRSVRAVTEAGIVILTCTLPAHDGKEHYDDAFCLGWNDEEG